MRNSSYAPHYAISRYSIREFNTGAEPFMVAMIIIIIIINMGRQTNPNEQQIRLVWKHLGPSKMAIKKILQL